MFGRKEEPKRRRTPRENLAQFGFVDMNFDGAINDGGSDDDEDLEAELLALTSSTAAKSKKPKPKLIPHEDLDKMVSESMQDDDEDDDESVDENDPELLSELNDLTGDADEEMTEPSTKIAGESEIISNHESVLSILEERLKMYQTAEVAAKESGEISRARRFTRGIKTLTDQIKAARSGRAVNEEDIPPPVLTRAAGSTPSPASAPNSSSNDINVPIPPDIAPAPVRPAPPPPVPPRSSPPEGPPKDILESPRETQDPSGSNNESSSLSYDPEIVAKLEERRGQYRQAAVSAKRAGNKDSALQFAHIVKQFDIVIAGVKAGEHADLSEMPPPPWETELGTTVAPIDVPKEDERQQQSSEQQPAEQGPPVPTTILEALTQRLELYQKQEGAAKADGNSSKARRMGRIVKQYQDAIKAHKAGKPISFEELPTPPGYAPIPVPGGVPSLAPPPSSPAQKPTQVVAQPGTPPGSHRSSTSSIPSTEKASGSPSRTNVRKSPASRQEKQMALLLSRQKAFKAAALQAKSRGEINQAREYLRLSKQFDALIEATESGLPVDLKTLPVPPDTKLELETDFDVVSHEDCVPGTDDEIYDRLLKDLLNQIQTCMTTRDHFKAMGDVASANRFENLAVHSKKDMDTIKHAIKRKDPVPKFHYETRIFSIVQCCTDLMDNDLELTIIQGINYNVPNPKDVDTYVKFELPWPSTEDPQRDRTVLIKDTNNPQYDAKFTLQIQRNVRACQRIFKRHGIKLEVWSRGAFLISLCCGPPNSVPSGFLRSDTLIGTATVKLQALENQCVLHDSFDLMDGRKAVGGKLEVKVRLRNPIVSKQVEQVTEKWLVLDH